MTHKAACLAVLGTGSDVGKSIVATALCRIFANRGLRVAPFKAQNMSNNSGVTPEGAEMGRAQIVQAEAARTAPHCDMNPVLLKPVSDVGSQVVLNGSAWMDATSRSYYRNKDFLFAESRAALDRLRSAYDVIVLEGAGSCAEVNLMANDIVNLRMAAYAEAPVVLVADIDRGGVFAQIVGTLACIAPEQQAQIGGFVINRFRGDLSLFQPGIDWIEQRTGKRVFGVLPWFRHFRIEAEDAVVIESPRPFQPTAAAEPAIAVIRLPHISNFTDFEPLSQLDGCRLIYLEQPQALSAFCAVILPGTKATCADLQWLADSGWRGHLLDYAAGGGHLLGICGGYQMLGTWVRDPDGIEGAPGAIAGLGLLPVETVLKAPKTTTLTDFTWDGIAGRGYEIHMGRTEPPESCSLVAVQARNRQPCADRDGCVAADGRIMGTYMHGLFDTPAITRRWLAGIGLGRIDVDRLHGPAARDQAYEQLAAHALAHLDIEALTALLPASLRERLR
ncbi:cobyric acid synthase [Desulfobulbus sp.]|uniref:cobyric acid synthase n=1 Tax=Desulfobulbus sp. TaxID=895 RepID=UPI00286EC61C|nr:cobyric acid synthase [Desulfobulbus sp.]